MGKNKLRSATLIQRKINHYITIKYLRCNTHYGSLVQVLIFNEYITWTRKFDSMKRTKWWINLIEWISISYFSNNYVHTLSVFSNFEKDLDSHWVLYCVWISHFSLKGWDGWFTLFDNLRVGLGVLEVLFVKFFSEDLLVAP